MQRVLRFYFQYRMVGYTPVEAWEFATAVDAVLRAEAHL